jgi:hypothetical protein
MDVEQLFGSWLVVRSEIPSPYSVGQEVLHFDGDGKHYWEILTAPNETKTFRFRVKETADGVMLQSGKDDRWRHLPARFDGSELLITGPHGYRSWLRRISREELNGPLRGLKYFFGE